MKRTDLLQTLKLTAPALLSDNDAVLPILKSLKFTGTHVIASNDVIAACLAVPVEEAGIVPGRKLISFLGACSSKTVKVSRGRKGSFLVKCGSAQLRLSTDEEEDWPFEFPDVEQSIATPVNEHFFSALAQCSAQSPDTGLGGWQGGIILVFDTVLGVYGIGRSRSTISYCRVEGIKPDGKTTRQVVVPSSFCKLAVAVADVVGKEAVLHTTEEAAVLEWGEGENVVATKLIDVDMPDVAARFSRVAKKTKDFMPITDQLRAALRRAAMIGDGGDCRIGSEEAGLRLQARGSGASLNELVTKGITEESPYVDSLVAADLISRRLDECTEIAFGENGTVMTSESGHFVYVVANREEKE